MSVYPRTYGEHMRIDTQRLSNTGLSPYLRGTRFLSHSARCNISVYPRTYGEHNSQITCIHRVDGLSPYLRGTHKTRPVCLISNRFIPVLTGNTTVYVVRGANKAVYPRTYGEHACSGGFTPFLNGLSPYLRGTRF
ncbi:hypothetical protein XNW1_1890008 [Xenorhabdus nematophila str. Websteri]|nr:hypothetical protein XNW1_1890008 [Xenorhabdus nematophila str. Websteri]